MSKNHEGDSFAEQLNHRISQLFEKLGKDDDHEWEMNQERKSKLDELKGRYISELNTKNLSSENLIAFAAALMAVNDRLFDLNGRIAERLNMSAIFMDEIVPYLDGNMAIKAKSEIEAMLRTAGAVKAANARHAENRAMKSDIFSWLDSNFDRFKSMDAAAEAIAGKLAPIAWRTARDWVGEWKKLRSAGTA